MFRKIFIANRGEIALRVIRACREMNIASAALFTPIDREGLWVRQADEAFELKGPDGRAGYLDIEAVLETAKRAKADAVHPGYGFLSEKPDFARACMEKGLAFIGPSPDAMKLCGHKTDARKLAERLGIPVMPGSGALENLAEAEREARRIGYPLLLKAAGGGGGRGMRLVHNAEQLKSSFESARREALTGFGDGTIFLEKYLIRPRHIEIQVLADHHGRAVHLGERECSIQRRHQKLIEEAPSPFVDSGLREKLARCALSLIQAACYANAGTVEFLADENRNFHFLEMNTRLQVEHPVTEMITGMDLVQEQIRIAAGRPLSRRQEEIKLNGWAFEARINCEDVNRNFLPSPGLVTHLEIPGGPGVRVDSALFAGCEIPAEFDSLVAKLIVRAPTRGEALSRMQRALSELQIGGIPTTLPFHQKIFRHPEFQKGLYSTRFLEEEAGSLAAGPTPEEKQAAAVMAAFEMKKPRPAEGLPETQKNKWNLAARLENARPFFANS